MLVRILAKEPPEELAGLALRLESQPLFKRLTKTLVAIRDGFSEPQRGFCFHRKPRQAFVEHVDGEAAFRGFEGVASVAFFEPGTADALEEFSVCAAEAPDVTLRPCVIASRKGLCSEEVQRLLEGVAAAPIPVRRARLIQELVKFVDVDPNLLAVEPIAIALARHSLTEELPRVADRLVEAVTASLRILARPDRLEDLVALRALAPEREKCDQLERAGAEASAAALATVDLERAEE